MDVDFLGVGIIGQVFIKDLLNCLPHGGPCLLPFLDDSMTDPVIAFGKTEDKDGYTLDYSDIADPEKAFAEEESEEGQAASSPTPNKQLRGGLHGNVDLGSDYISYSVLNGAQPAKQEPAPDQTEQTEDAEQAADTPSESAPADEASPDPEPSPSAESAQPTQSEDTPDPDNSDNKE